MLEPSGISPNLLFTRQARQVLNDVGARGRLLLHPRPLRGSGGGAAEPPAGAVGAGPLCRPGGKATYIAELMRDRAK
jgi:hypothetical protein